MYTHTTPSASTIQTTSPVRRTHTRARAAIAAAAVVLLGTLAPVSQLSPVHASGVAGTAVQDQQFGTTDGDFANIIGTSADTASWGAALHRWDLRQSRSGQPLSGGELPTLSHRGSHRTDLQHWQQRPAQRCGACHGGRGAESTDARRCELGPGAGAASGARDRREAVYYRPEQSGAPAVRLPLVRRRVWNPVQWWGYPGQRWGRLGCVPRTTEFRLPDVRDPLRIHRDARERHRCRYLL